MLNDDMPFIIDSVTAYLTAQHLTIHRLIHPVLRVGRDSSGALGDLHDAARNGGAGLESCVFIEIDHCASESALLELERGLIDVLDDLRAVVGGWKRMLTKLTDTAALLRQIPSPAYRRRKLTRPLSS